MQKVGRKVAKRLHKGDKKGASGVQSVTDISNRFSSRLEVVRLSIWHILKIARLFVPSTNFLSEEVYDL